MQTLLAKVTSLLNENTKLGVFGKEQNAYICPNGNKNSKEIELCKIAKKITKDLAVQKGKRFRY